MAADTPRRRLREALLDGAKHVLATRGEARFVVVQHGWGGGGFARTLYQESPGATVCVVSVPVDFLNGAKIAEWVRHELSAADGFAEASYGAEGVRREPRLRLLDLEQTQLTSEQSERPLQSSPLIPALSPLRGEGARPALTEMGKVGSAPVAAHTLTDDDQAREAGEAFPRLPVASPSPLNEREP